MKTEKLQRDRIDGVLLLDKPQALTSNDALAIARRLLNAEKAGHGGTLDPMATGLLPLLFGEATKFALDLLEADKTYWARLTLGVTTDSADADGKVLETRPVSIDEAALRAAAQRFTGEIGQLPPMYSALKRDGRPLYEYARAGLTVDRKPRTVTIRRLEVLEFAPPIATIRVCCSKGTYIRTLAEDLGRVLGCGAHLSALRREAVGELTIGDAVTLDALQPDTLAGRRDRMRSLDTLLSSLPSIELQAADAARFLNGQRIRIDSSSTSGERARRARVYGAGRLLGVATLAEGLLAPQRLIASPSTHSADPRARITTESLS